jgi:formate hydrogenlyase subunit 6/NADH:ubiquinone oxidoreductase subunit I
MAPVGHLAAKDVYRKLGSKLDGLQVRTPWSETLHGLLKELYSAEEAELVVRMPYAPATLDRITRITGLAGAQAERLLESLAEKGLVIDIWSERAQQKLYVISPMVVGIFEFTMMREAPESDTRRRAQLLREYLSSDGFFEANFAGGERFFVARALPHESTVLPEAYAEILDYERASAIVDQNERWSIGVCSCRHEKLHAGLKQCDTPLHTCTSAGYAADYLVRHGMARAASQEEIRDLLVRSQEQGLMLAADNVKRDVTFICHCCSCCCNLVEAITRHGCLNTVVSSNYLAQSNPAECEGCGKCVEACPVGAISLSEPPAGGKRRQRRPQVDEARCLGCGVCALRCPTDAMHLAERPQRVLHPENTFERAILQSLERGTLQNLIFDNPQSSSQGFMRALVGGLLRLSPVKRALCSEALRSRFLGWLTAAASRQGHADFAGR